MFTLTINASLILESCNPISNIADFKETQQNIKKNNIFLLCNLNVTETSCTRSLLSTYRTSDSSKSRQTVFFLITANCFFFKSRQTVVFLNHGKLLFILIMANCVFFKSWQTQLDSKQLLSQKKHGKISFYM